MHSLCILLKEQKENKRRYTPKIMHVSFYCFRFKCISKVSKMINIKPKLSLIFLNNDIDMSRTNNTRSLLKTMKL